MANPLLIANNRYFPSGGPERYLFTIEKALPDHGITPVPMALALDANLPSFASKWFVNPPVDDRYIFYSDRPLGTVEKFKLATKVIYDPAARRQIRSAIRENDCKGVLALQIAHYLYPECILAAADCDVPAVMRLSDFQLLCPAYSMFLDGMPCRQCEDGLHHALIHRCLKGSVAVTAARVAAMAFHRLMRVTDMVSAFICPSEFMKHMMIAFGFPKRKLVHLPTPVSHELTKLRVVPVPENGPALFVGGLYEAKGAQVAVEAAIRHGFNLIVAGETNTPLGERLVEKVNRSDKGNVEFTGFVDGEDLAALYRKASCVIVPSLWYENSPNVALEAMAHGRPVVASDLGSLPETVVDNSTGALFVPGNPDDLADKVMAILSNPEKAFHLGQNGRKLVLEKHNLDDHVSALANLFGRLW